MPPKRKSAAESPPGTPVLGAAPRTPPQSPQHKSIMSIISTKKNPDAASEEQRAAAAPSSTAKEIPQTPTVSDADDPSFRSIKHAACADAYHDFGHKTGAANWTSLEQSIGPGLGQLRKGLDDRKFPGEPVGTKQKDVPVLTQLHDEDSMLKELFGGSTIDFTSTKKLARAVRKEGGTLDIELQNTIYGPQSYVIKSLHSGDNYDVGLINRNSIKTRQAEENRTKPVLENPAAPQIFTQQDIADFFGSNTINLLFDAFIIDTSSIIVNAKGAGLTVNRIVNRELINDPAPKTYEIPADDVAAARANGNVYNIIFDSCKDDIIYLHNPQDLINDELQRNKFFSKYDFRLSPLNSLKKNALPRISMTLTNPNLEINKGKVIEAPEVVYLNDDPHQNNNIAHCWKRIQKIFGSQKTKGAVERGGHEEISAHFQCKRSGDWLQALSCLDTGRSYVNNEGEDIELEGNKEGVNIILVTHDRILLWYALFMGLDVVLTWKVPGAFDDSKDVGDDDGKEEEEMGDDEEVADDPKSQKRMFYFSNARRAGSPEERQLRIIDMVDTTINEQVDVKMLQFVKTYNGWLDELKEEIRGELNMSEPDFGTTESVARNAYSDTLMAIIKSYWRYSSIKFTHLSGTEISSFKEAYLESRNAYFTAKAAYDSKPFEGNNQTDYLAALEDYSKKGSAFLSRCRNIQCIESKIKNKDDLNSSLADYYNKDPLYTSMHQVDSIYRESRARVTRDDVENLTPLQKVVTTATHLVEKCSKEDVLQLYNFISTLGKDLTYQTIIDKRTKSYVPIFLTTLRTVNSTPDESVTMGREVLTVMKDVIVDEAAEHMELTKDELAPTGSVGSNVTEQLLEMAEKNVEVTNEEEEVAQEAASQDENSATLATKERELAETYSALRARGPRPPGAKSAALWDKRKKADEDTISELTEEITAIKKRLGIEEEPASPDADSPDAASPVAAADVDDSDDIVKDSLPDNCKDETGDIYGWCLGVASDIERKGKIVYSKVKAFVNSATARHNLANYFSNFLPALAYKPSVAVGGADSDVGGIPANVRAARAAKWAAEHHEQAVQDTVTPHDMHYIMFILYAMELVTQIESFETASDEGFIYYDSLAKLTLAATASKENAPDNLRYSRFVSYLYDQIPNLDTAASAAFSPDSIFMSRVACIGRNVALQSLDFSTHENKSLAFGATTTVPLVTMVGEKAGGHVAEEYNKLVVQSKQYTKFSERKSWLCTQLLQRITMSASPDSPLFGQQLAAAAAPAKKTGVFTINNVGRAVAGPGTEEVYVGEKYAPTAVRVGGRRTRKIRGGGRGRGQTRKQRGYKKRCSSRRQRN